MGKGASASQTGPLTEGGAASASPAKPSVPSADDVRAVAAMLEPKDFEPFVRRAADELYERIMRACEDYLRDNVEWNIASHISMLERENQRMRTELWEVNKALGCHSLGHETRINAVNELHTRHNRATNELWRLREQLASAIEAQRAATAETGAVHESAVGEAETPNPNQETPHEDS